MRRVLFSVLCLFLMAGCGSSGGGSGNNGGPTALAGRNILITPSGGGPAYLAAFESTTVALSQVQPYNASGSGALSALATATFLAGGTITETVETAVSQTGNVASAEAVFPNGETVEVEVTLDESDDISDVDLTVDSVALPSDFRDFLFRSPSDLKVQPDGRIVVGGVASLEGDVTSTGSLNGHALISRFEADGRPDTSFGVEGNVVEDFGLGGTGYANRIVLLPDGKILAGGLSDTSAGFRLFVARYLADGTRDTTFGSGGVFFSSVGSSAADLKVQSDGKILVAGINGLIRLNANGSLDAGFGVSGVAPSPEVPVTGGVVVLPFQGVLPLSDGKILTATPYGLTSDTTLFLTRFLADGTLDTTFGSSGVATAELGSGFGLSGAVIDLFSDASILVGGSYKNDGLNRSGFWLAKFSSGGTPAGGFGTAGVRSVETSEPHPGAGADFDQVIQDDGIFVASFFQTFSSLSANDIGADFAVFAFDSSGTPDAAFATGGRIVTDIATSAGGTDRSYDASNCIDRAPDGSIVVGGNSGFGITLVRY